MSDNVITTDITPLRWEDDAILLLDQRYLPGAELYSACTTVDAVAEAIRTLAVRGAPLIGIAAAYGMALGARTTPDRQALASIQAQLAGTRPTAVNLFWALERCRRVIDAQPPDTGMVEIAAALLAEARAIHAEDAAACQAIANAGSPLFPRNARILTHCNAGALATGGVGTALGVIRAAHRDGRVKHVWVDETRPLLQGARLTAWELAHDQIPFYLICDNMAASLMAAGEVDAVVVGADRITRNGDFANKIGTYNVAVLARAHGIPFYVAAPWSTIDLHLADGSAMPIEFRAGGEICHCGDQRIAPEGIHAWNPSFDVTPGHYVHAYITERGALQAPFAAE